MVGKTVFFLFLASCFTPWVSAPLALLLGVLSTHFFEHPFQRSNTKVTNFLLKASIIGLGFGMNLKLVVEAGQQGIFFTFASIVLTLMLGFLLSKAIKTDKITGFLISVGTAICGGSAIAAVGPIIGAKEKEMSVSLGIVFLLNAIALLIFPSIGYYFGMNETQFGLWAAVAIHDTSSVVASAAEYGEEALLTATTVKLTRALWIIPITLIMAFFVKGEDKKIKRPYFIGLFIIAICISHYFSDYKVFFSSIAGVSKKVLILTLFLIGSGITIESIKSAGIRAMLMGLILWVIVGISTLLALQYL